MEKSLDCLFVRGRLACSTSYDTAKNLQLLHFHLLFFRDLAVVFDAFLDFYVLTTERYESVEYHFRGMLVSCLSTTVNCQLNRRPQTGTAQGVGLGGLAPHFFGLLIKSQP